MLKTNYHTHSKFCDGTGSPEDYVIEAVDKGFDVLGFSSHAPLPFENDWTMPKAALDEYLNETGRLKKAYKNIIELKIGLEIDYIEGEMAPSDKYYQDLNLDYIIGSVHVLPDAVTGKYLGVEYTKSEIERLIKETFKGDTKALVKEYYRLLRSMSEKGGFKILGHLDVVKKNNIKSVYFDETEKWYKEEIKLTLQCISDNNQIIEINTGKVLNNPAGIYPSPWILKIAKEYNIPVMLNSDAHIPNRIDNFYIQAKDIILNAGYTELMVLKEDRWMSDKIR